MLTKMKWGERESPEDKKIFRSMFSEQRMEAAALKIEISNNEFYLLELFRQ